MIAQSINFQGTKKIIWSQISHPILKFHMNTGLCPPPPSMLGAHNRVGVVGGVASELWVGGDHASPAQ